MNAYYFFNKPSKKIRFLSKPTNLGGLAIFCIKKQGFGGVLECSNGGSLHHIRRWNLRKLTSETIFILIT